MSILSVVDQYSSGGVFLRWVLLSYCMSSLKSGKLKCICKNYWVYIAWGTVAGGKAECDLATSKCKLHSKIVKAVAMNCLIQEVQSISMFCKLFDSQHEHCLVHSCVTKAIEWENAGIPSIQDCFHSNWACSDTRNAITTFKWNKDSEFTLAMWRNEAQ
jgi:hypothetical protein